jgi:hypothetical protein
LNSHHSFLVLTDVQLSDAANYSVVATNEVFYLPGVLSPAGRLTVVAETDGDGLPDDWETANQLDPDNPDDAALDSDGDGMTNGEEYIAGTDPQDLNSYLRVDALSVADTAILEFMAVSNRTYVVEYADDLNTGLWQRLAELSAAPTNRILTVIDPDVPENGNQRFYRLVTPRDNP